MNYRRVGQSGLKVSELSLGGWSTFGRTIHDQKLAKDIILKAYESGVNFFDIADIYATGESERMMGKVFKQLPRHTLVISSKVFFDMTEDVNDRGLSRKHIMESIDKSLERIGTDYLDIYFCHRWDPDVPLLETMRAMDDLVHRGKITYWGISEWSADQIQEVMDLAEKYYLYPPIVDQPRYSLLTRQELEASILPKAEQHGLGLTVYSPLARGLLTGKYDDGIPENSRMAQIDWQKEQSMTEDRLEKVRQFKAVADDLGHSRSEVALAWTLRHPAVSSVITGATSVEQMESNLRAAEVKLSEDVLKRLDGIFPPDLDILDIV